MSSDDTAPQPPAAPEIEAALLGAILMSPKRINDVGDFLRPEHFYDTLHSLIFDTMLQLNHNSQNIDPKALAAVLSGTALYDQVGGNKYMGQLARAAVTTQESSVRHYAEVLVDLSMRRELIEHAIELQARCYGAVAEQSARDIIDAHEADLLRLTGATDSRGGLVNFNDVLTATYAQWERETKGAQGVPTGFADVDKLLGGLHPTDLIIVAGRASMGKTAWALNVAFNAAMFFRSSTDLEYRGRQVVFFSMEMSKEQLGSRVITGQTRIVAPRNRWGDEMQEHEWGTALDMARSHGNLPFWVDDTADQTIARLRSRCVRLHRKKPIGLIVIDYLQLMSGDSKNRQASRVEVISDITRGLKKMAKELGVPVIALSQLSRAVEQRDNKRPILSDLRESGSIEMDADIVLFPYRAEYYLQQEGKSPRKTNESTETYASRLATAAAAMAECAGQCEIIVGKQRHGPIGSAFIQFDKARTWFSDLEREQPVPKEEQLL